jgi:hypothetical protein
VRQRGIRAEVILQKLAYFFQDEASEDRAYDAFHTRSFAALRKEKHSKHLTEADCVQLYYSKVLAWQLQQVEVYHDDVHLRDKLIMTFSTNSKQLNESFTTKRPKTSNQVLQRVKRNCSYELGIDLLPDRDADVLRTDVKVNYLTNKLRGHSVRVPTYTCGDTCIA